MIGQQPITNSRMIQFRELNVKVKFLFSHASDMALAMAFIVPRG